MIGRKCDHDGAFGEKRGMKWLILFILKKSDCKNYKCVCHCSVQAISFQEILQHVVADGIQSGQCVVCPQDAQKIPSDVESGDASRWRCASILKRGSFIRRLLCGNWH